MQKTRNEIIHYLNHCQNCYCAVTDDSGKTEAACIDQWYVTEKLVIAAVDNDNIKILSRGQNSNIAFAAWSGLVGYQIKGKVISEENSAEYSDEIEKFMASLTDGDNDLFSRRLILTAITDIYCVTPGKEAGNLLFHMGN